MKQFKLLILFILLVPSMLFAQEYSYTIHKDGKASVVRIEDGTKYRFNGVIPVGEKIHPDIPDYIKESILMAWEANYRKVELKQVSGEEIYRTEMVEKVKKDEAGKKVVKKSRSEPDGYEIVDGKVRQKTKETVIYEKEKVPEKKVRDDIFLDRETGKVYEKATDGRVHKENGKYIQWIKK